VKKTYLGDSVYCASDGFGLWLTTENGYPDDPRNKIYLEPEVYHALIEFVARLRGPERDDIVAEIHRQADEATGGTQ
jgi:hypothetical protein